MSEALPVLVLAGFAGSGRTTLLSRWLEAPELARSAVLMNEPGALAVDQHLLARRATVRSVCGQCLCCSPGTVAGVLEALFEARARREVPEFNRVVIEVSGLADPVPILRALEGDARLRERCRLEGVVTTIDAIEGERSLDAMREAVAQVMVADALVITKADIARDFDRLEARLAKLNPLAPVTRSTDGGAHPQLVMAGVHASSGGDERRERAAALPQRSHERVDEGDRRAVPVHGGLRAVTLPADTPMDPEALRSRLEAFLERHGAAVARLKGLVPIEGRAGVAVVQAVGGMLYPVRVLARLPEGARGSITVISRKLGEAEISGLLGEGVVAI